MIIISCFRDWHVKYLMVYADNLLKNNNCDYKLSVDYHNQHP